MSRALPFFRRRARIFLPFFVLIRFRNPWSRFLFKFEGFRDVNDMVQFSFRPFSYQLSILWVNGIRVKRIFGSFTCYSRFCSLTGYRQEDIVEFSFLAFSPSIEQDFFCYDPSKDSRISFLSKSPNGNTSRPLPGPWPLNMVSLKFGFPYLNSLNCTPGVSGEPRTLSKRKCIPSQTGTEVL